MLELSARSRYSLRMLAYLTSTGDRIVTAGEIADAEGISLDYVEQILSKLRGAGFVRSRRGAKGGFALACDPGRTTVADVVRVFEGPARVAPCQETPCIRASLCSTRWVWQEARDAFLRVLSSATLAEIARRAQDVQNTRSPNYAI